MPEEACRKYTGVVDNEQIARLKEGWKCRNYTMSDDAGFAREVQQARARSFGRWFLRDQLGRQLEIEVGNVHRYFPRSNRPRAESSGFHKSPRRATRFGTFFMVKSSIRTPRSISFQVTGVDTVASGRGRTE